MKVLRSYRKKSNDFILFCEKKYIFLNCKLKNNNKIEIEK